MKSINILNLKGCNSVYGPGSDEEKASEWGYQGEETYESRVIESGTGAEEGEGNSDYYKGYAMIPNM